MRSTRRSCARTRSGRTDWEVVRWTWADLPRLRRHRRPDPRALPHLSRSHTRNWARTQVTTCVRARHLACEHPRVCAEGLQLGGHLRQRGVRRRRAVGEPITVGTVGSRRSRLRRTAPRRRRARCRPRGRSQPGLVELELEPAAVAAPRRGVHRQHVLVNSGCRELSSPAARMAGVLLDGLDDEQRAAATAPRGPVCVLAGAGTGKTRTITHRIAHLVRTGHVAPGQVLAVTFTARAAGEMRTRLRALGVAGVQARTFHAAALRQLRYFWPRVVGGPPWQLLEGKLRDRRAGRGPGEVGTDAATLRDLAGEIEWAKASLVAPGGLPGRGGAAAPRRRRGPPSRSPPSTRATRRLKNAAELLDFDDLLLHTAAALEEHGDVARGVPRPLPLLRRRRVPGRHPAAAAGARRVARRARRPHRGRRRQPDDLHVRRRQPEAPARLPAALPRGRRRAAAARLPLHPAGRRGGQHADRRGPRPARGHPAAAGRPAPGRARPGFHRARRRARRGRRGRRPRSGG